MDLILWNRENYISLLSTLPADSPTEKMVNLWLVAESEILVENSNNSLMLLQADEQFMPIVIGKKRRKKPLSYVVSMLTQYFDYSLVEIKKQDYYPNYLKTLAKVSIPMARFLFEKMGFDDVVFVNNWLFSTNLYPNFTTREWQEIVAFLRNAFRGKALVFKGIDELIYAREKQIFENLGALGVSARLLFVFDPTKVDYLKKRPNQQDKKKWQNQTEFVMESLQSLNDNEAQEILTLYRELYIEKHSAFNPNYSEQFLNLLFETGLVEFQVIKNYKGIQAVQLTWLRSGTLTTPFIGYNQSLPRDSGLYRFLSLHLIEKSVALSAILNMSSGAGDFKSQRGGVPVFEYNMVLVDGLPFYKKWMWQIFYFISKNYIQKGMLKFGA